MKAWLNCPVGIVPLSTDRPTTIGRECCDIINPDTSTQPITDVPSNVSEKTITDWLTRWRFSPAVDPKHAVIEYDDCNDCFVVRDLNTIFGTYVNGYQVCDSVYRLTPGDVIKIGLGQTATPYEFDTDNSSCPCPHHTRKTCLKSSLPQLSTASSAPSSTASNLSVCHHGNSYPSFQQTRPFSARVTSNSMPYSGSTLKQHPSGSNRQAYKDGRACNEPCVSWEEVLKKDRKISELNDEVHRLRKCEVENRHKDCRLKELTSQVDCLQNQLSQAVSNAGNRIEVEALQARILDLENQTQLRTNEMAEINEQMFTLKTASQKQLNDKVLEINGLREEQERLRKDKNILSGLLTQVQKDISMKDTTICRLTSDIERKKNDLSDKDMQIASYQSSFCVVAAHKQLESELETMRSELTSVAEKLKSSETSLKKDQERFISLSKAMEKAKVDLRQEKQHQKDIRKQLEETSAKQGDANKTNDSLTQELRDLTNTLSRLRRRLQRLLSLRSLASAKAVTVTDDEDELTDDQIISKIKEIIEDGDNLRVKLSDMNKKFEDVETKLKSVTDCGGKLKEELQVSTGFMNPNPANTLRLLRQELNAVQLVISLPVLQDFREILFSMIQVQLSWQSGMVATLESTGFNVMLSDVDLVKHVAELHSQAVESHRVQESSKAKLEEASRQFRRDLEEARDRGRREVEEKTRDRIERLVIESEMRIRTEKAVVEQKEKEIYEEKASEERMKVALLDERLCCLQKEIAEKSEELLFFKQQEKQHNEEVEAYRKVEAELRDEILERNLAKIETKATIENSLRKKYEREMVALREQSAHLSYTLASIQERLSKANNKIHRQQLEITSLQCNPHATVKVTPYNKTTGEPVAHASFEVSRVNEKLRAEIKKHLAEIKKQGLEVDQCRSLITERDGMIGRLEAELQKAKEEAAHIQAQSRLSSELSAAGIECRAEQHVTTIAKQKEALVELRKRMKTIESRMVHQSAKIPDDSSLSTDLNPNFPPTGRNDPESKSDGLMDTVLPKKVKEKAMVVVPNSASIASTLLPVDTVCGQGQRVQMSDVQDNQNKDLKENLESSEQAYSSLLKVITEKLPVAKTARKIPSLTDQTMFAERNEISAKRQVTCEEIEAQLSVLTDKVTEYESTIRKYDQELMKLRTADVLLESKSWQIDGLTSDVRSLVDEVACLHESLTKVREELRKEKRANAIAKGKKVCGEKGDKGRTMGTIVKHTCFHNDSIYKTKERSRSAEKPKIKSYEIMTLKEEMKKCERNLARARNVELQMANSDLIDCLLQDEHLDGESE